MSERKLKSRSTGSSESIDNHRLAFCATRFHDSDDNALWVWSIKSGVYGEVLFRIADIQTQDLRKMIKVLESQIALIETDGHPKYDEVLAPSKEGETS